MCVQDVFFDVTRIIEVVYDAIMILVVGLGNPGEKYASTRHNIGWWLLEYVQSSLNFSDWRSEKKFQAEVSQGKVEEHEVVLFKPQIFMNNSGNAVSVAVAEYTPDEVVVIHDDIDLPLGMLRVSYDRGAGGHNGVQSIIDTLQTTTFTRMRIGIAPVSDTGEVIKPAVVESFVLKEFSSADQEGFEEKKELYRKALETIITKSVVVAMNECNVTS